MTRTETVTIHVLTTDGAIHRVEHTGPVQLTGDGGLYETIRDAGLSDRVAVAQAWGEPRPQSAAAAERAGCLYWWSPAPSDAIARAYEQADLRLDAPLADPSNRMWWTDYDGYGD